MRQTSFERFPSYSELTASNSRSVADTVNKGEMKNCAKLKETRKEKKQAFVKHTHRGPQVINLD